MTIRTTVDEGIATLTLDHPPLNILTRAVLAELREELARLAGDHGVRVLLLVAEGQHFSAGADVGEHLPPEFHELIPQFLATVRALAEFPRAGGRRGARASAWAAGSSWRRRPTSWSRARARRSGSPRS